MTSNPYGYSLDRSSMTEETPLYLASSRKARLRYTTDTGGTHLGPIIDLSRESDQYSFGQALASRGVELPRNASAYMVKGHEGYVSREIAMQPIYEMAARELGIDLPESRWRGAT